MSPSDDITKAHQVLFDEGMKVRKAVLGAEHVEKSMGAVSEFAMPIQHIVTEACWGAIWTRPGLERKTRSMINIAMLTALNRYCSCVCCLSGYASSSALHCGCSGTVGVAGCNCLIVALRLIDRAFMNGVLGTDVNYL